MCVDDNSHRQRIVARRCGKGLASPQPDLSIEDREKKYDRDDVNDILLLRRFSSGLLRTPSPKDYSDTHHHVLRYLSLSSEGAPPPHDLGQLSQ